MSFEIGPNLHGFQNPSYLREGQDKAINKGNAQSSEPNQVVEKTTVAKRTAASDIETQSPKARLNAIANRAFESQSIQEQVSLLQTQNAALDEALTVLEKLDTLVSSQEDNSDVNQAFSELKTSLESITDATFNNQALFDGGEGAGAVSLNRSLRSYGVSRQDLQEALSPIVNRDTPQGLNPALVRTASNVLSEMAGRAGAAESQITENAMAVITEGDAIDLEALSGRVRDQLNGQIHGNIQPGNIPRLIN
ncbi:MAG: hypothetical protein AAGB06_01715 [Verrucomicrobiota bacterium]